jgi:hypothetical protein
MTRTVSFVLLAIPAALAVAGGASAAGPPTHGMPPGRLCGSVSGAPWTFQGQRGTHYNVTASSSAVCSSALKSVSALTRQKPHQGVLGARTLTGPGAFKCMNTGVGNAGFCGDNGSARFFWAPRLNG